MHIYTNNFLTVEKHSPGLKLANMDDEIPD